LLRIYFENFDAIIARNEQLHKLSPKDSIAQDNLEIGSLYGLQQSICRKLRIYNHSLKLNLDSKSLLNCSIQI
jgi:hypothetical protein